MTLHKAAAKARNTRKQRKNQHPLLETFEPRVLLTAATGSVDFLSRTQIIGWARDADTPGTAITVQVKVDGNATNVTAQQSLPAYNGTIAAGHAFTFTMPTLGPGTHTVTVSAADSTSGALTVIKNTTVTNPAPIGNVEVLNGTTVSGWAFDKDAGASSIQVEIDNNGVAGTPFSASNNRPDLTSFPPVGSPLHGFSASGSFGIVDVYALDAPTGNKVLLKTNSVKATGHLDILQINRIAGWAWTPDMGANPMNIEVWVDGSLFQTGSTGTNRPDLTARNGGNANTGFDFALNAVPPGKHTVQVFAIDSKTTSSNARVLIGQGTLTNKNPIGNIDVVNANGISGWVSDPDAGPTSIKYTVKVDDVAVITGATASNPRPDLTSYPPVGSPNHGFNSALSNLSAGPHKIQLFALDAPSGQEVLIQTKFINNTKPFGFLDFANQVAVKGWAYDPDSPGTPVQIIVSLDGVRDVPHPADQRRDDLLTILPDAFHSFVIQTPTHLAGTHTIKVIAVDTFTGEEVVLGTRVFKNTAPRGQVLSYTSTGVTGWAQDPDQPGVNSGPPFTVIISVDGRLGATTPNLPTSASLTRIIGTPNHGFSVTFKTLFNDPNFKLSRGSHLIKVFVADSVTGVSTLIGSKNLVVA
jgi:hypothetical protein